MKENNLIIWISILGILTIVILSNPSIINLASIIPDNRIGELYKDNYGIMPVPNTNYWYVYNDCSEVSNAVTCSDLPPMSFPDFYNPDQPDPIKFFDKSTAYSYIDNYNANNPTNINSPGTPYFPTKQNKPAPDITPILTPQPTPQQLLTQKYSEFYNGFGIVQLSSGVNLYMVSKDCRFLTSDNYICEGGYLNPNDPYVSISDAKKAIDDYLITPTPTPTPTYNAIITPIPTDTPTDYYPTHTPPQPQTMPGFDIISSLIILILLFKKRR